MVDLEEAIKAQGYVVFHIKTDSVKIADADEDIIEFVKAFGLKYGYNFEYNPAEDHYDAVCLVNDAVYIARKGREWTAVGAQFQHPYVHKTLFTREELEFDDYCETKQVVQGAMYIDFRPEVPGTPTINDMHFVGKTGRFVPVVEGFGGGTLYRVKDGKPYAVAGTKGYLWVEADVAWSMFKDGQGTPFSEQSAEFIDMRYFNKLAEDARNAIDYFGEYARFVG